MTSYETVAAAAKILDAKKAEDIRAIDIDGISIIADYFLIASGGSSTQVKALAEELEQKLAELGVEPRRIEGTQSASWIIIDYGDVIIHIFYRETRQFFNLERLWADGKPIDSAELLK
ncbi:MAG: ribosome silencing factor [Clostridia bacterium]|nr:ribosome silencing factor [Clostridia bacterium]MDR3645802.1 ribosome silencing factor [Clostridia bacterium]